MEYLTIQDPRASHLGGMDPYAPDPYGVRSRDAAPRLPKAPSYDRVQSSSPSYPRARLAVTSAPEPQRWHQPAGPESSRHSRSPVGSAPGSHPSSAPGAESYSNSGSSFSPSHYSRPSHSKPSTEWAHPVQPVPVRPVGQAVHALQANEEQQSVKLPSFNSVSDFLKPAVKLVC
jgi:hypothetical protein